MGILQGLERRLQGAVDKTFARIFGGSVQPAEVTTALAHEAAARSTTQAGRTIAPNRYVVELGPSDAADVGEDLRRVSSAFSAMLASYIRDQGWDTYAEVDVTLRESERLHTGQFRVSSLVDPGLGGRHPGNIHDGMYDAARSAAPSRLPGSRPAAQQYGPPPVPPTVTPGYGQPNRYGYPEPYPPAPQQPPAPGYAASYPSGPTPYPDNGVGYGQQAQQPHPDQYGYAPVPAPGPRLMVDDGTGRSYALQRGSNVVGRGQSAALRLADTSVSREHIDVYFDGRAAVVHDLGSTNGTTVNGTAIQTWQLADGDVIRVGQSTVIFCAR